MPINVPPQKDPILPKTMINDVAVPRYLDTQCHCNGNARDYIYENDKTNDDQMKFREDIQRKT